MTWAQKAAETAAYVERARAALASEWMRYHIERTLPDGPWQVLCAVTDQLFDVELTNDPLNMELAKEYLATNYGLRNI